MYVRPMKNTHQLLHIGEEQITSYNYKKRKCVKMQDINGFDPGDDEVGLGPYHSIRREKITLIKRNEEKW